MCGVVNVHTKHNIVTVQWNLSVWERLKKAEVLPPAARSGLSTWRFLVSMNQFHFVRRQKHRRTFLQSDFKCVKCSAVIPRHMVISHPLYTFVNASLTGPFRSITLCFHTGGESHYNCNPSLSSSQAAGSRQSMEQSSGFSTVSCSRPQPSQQSHV